MKIMFLNCWYGKVGEKFYEYLSSQENSTDVFCFSEVYPEMFIKLNNLLTDYNGRYETSVFDDALGYLYGQAIFVKKVFKTLNHKRIDLFKNIHNDQGMLQNFDLILGNKIINITNIHGKAHPGHKLDTPARLRQSKMIIDFVKDKKTPKIIGGDFNLLPNSRSVKMFEKDGFRNLITEYNIKDTRGELNHKKFKVGDRQYFADYCFVKDVKVNSFEVPNVKISDHLPLILEIEI